MEEEGDYESWNINIRRVSNGYIITKISDEGFPYEEVFSESEDDSDVPGEISCLRNLLDNVIDYFGGFGSRHDKWRLRTTFEHGDKWHGKEE